MATNGKYPSWDDDDIRALPRERLRPLQLIGIAVALVAACALPLLFLELAQGFTETIESAAPPTQPVRDETVSILVPRVPIKAGEKLIDLQFKRVDVAKQSSRARAVSDLDSLTGAHARRDLFPDVPLMAEDIRVGEAPNEVVSNIPPGFRAISLAVTSTSAVEGWASPGADVDVVLIAKHQGVDTSNVLARGVLVLSVDRKSSQAAPSGAEIPTTITLLLRKNEAARIALAARIGSIVLHLRGFRETGAGGASQLVVKDLYRSRPVPDPKFKAMSAEEISRPSLGREYAR